MFNLASLWLPTVLSTVAVFVLSSIIHMVTPWHHSDYKRLPKEDQTRLMDALRSVPMEPGDYMVPMPANQTEMQSPEFKALAERGPRAHLILWPAGAFSLGRPLLMYFLYSLAVSGFAGHIAAAALGGSTNHRLIFHTVGLTAFLGYAAALWQMSIWYRRSWVTTLKLTVDGLIYGVATALIFVWLWT